MDWFRSLPERIRALLRGRNMDAELDEEVRFHLEMETEKNLQAGMGPREARRRAMVAFGGVDRFQEQTRDERGVTPVADLLQDIRYAARQMARNPGFTAVAALTLALGVGATTTIFSVVDGILLTPLPFHEPDRLVEVWPEQTFTKSMLEDFRGEVPFLAGLAAYSYRSFTLSGEGDAGPHGFRDGTSRGLQSTNPNASSPAPENRRNTTPNGPSQATPGRSWDTTPEELGGASVSHDYFQLLGATPALGRAFLPEDEEPGRGMVVILDHGLWERRFGADPEILGKSVYVGDEGGALRTVVGVMPPDYRPLHETWHLWVPFQIDPSNFPDYQGTASLHLLGRMGPGLTVEAADARFHEVAVRLTEDLQFITDDERAAAGLLPLKEALLGDVSLRLLILLGSVGMVLLLACINVANLLLARGQGRNRELGIRLAMGAGRGRVVRQLLTESLVLGVLGGGLGVVLSYWAVPALVGIVPSSVPRVDLIALDGRVLAFSLAVTLAATLLFGLVPARKATGRDLQSSLKDGGQGRTQSASGTRLRNGLVVAELALAVVVVVGATLLFRSFWLLQQVDPGFETNHVLTLRVTPPSDHYPDGASRHTLLDDAARQIAALPGVTNVGWTGALPMGGGSMGIRYHSDDSAVPQEDLPTYANVRAVSPGFFSSLGIPLVEGAYPEGLTGEEEEEQVLVNRALALSLWPDGENPVGRTVWLPFGSELPARIVGMTADFAQSSLDRAPRPEIFVPWELWTPAQMYMVARTSGDPEALVPGVRAAIWGLDENLPMAYVRTMAEVVARTTADARLTTLLLALFGGLALTLGAIGVYGVASYTVSQSTYEIGVRMALGAPKEGVLLGVLRRFLGLAAAGVLLGTVAALGASRVLASLLYQVSPRDPSTFLGVALTLALVTLAAVLAPAYRASRVEPARVLKEE